MSPNQIQSLRKKLGENTAEFGRRFCLTSRAVEDWEQGRRRPHPLVERAIRELAGKNGVKKTLRNGR